MTWDSVRAREAEFGKRVAELFGIDPKYVANASAEELRTEHGVTHRTIRVELVRTVTQEEALRLRYGNDVEIETTASGYNVRIPAVQIPAVEIPEERPWVLPDRGPHDRGPERR